MNATFFPPADATDAMSNWVTKPGTLMARCKASEYRPLQVIGRLDPLITRVTLPILLVIASSMDCFYNAVWFSIKAVVVCSRGAVQLLTRNRYGHFAPDVTAKDVGIHLYKCIVFFGAIFGAPVMAVSSPDRLIEEYRKRGLILPEKKEEEKKPEEAPKTLLERLKGYGKTAFEKLKQAPAEGRRLVVENPGKATFLSAALVSVAAFAFRSLR